MKAKTHSILSVVNGHANAPRRLTEPSIDDCDQIETNGRCDLQNASPENAVPNSKPESRRDDEKSSATAPWGILFGAEYIWAPFFGPMLMVYPSKASMIRLQNANSENKQVMGPCCILLFDNQLSTCSSLHVFHTN